MTIWEKRVPSRKDRQSEVPEAQLYWRGGRKASITGTERAGSDSGGEGGKGQIIQHLEVTIKSRGCKHKWDYSRETESREEFNT